MLPVPTASLVHALTRDRPRGIRFHRNIGAAGTRTPLAPLDRARTGLDGEHAQQVGLCTLVADSSQSAVLATPAPMKSFIY